MPRPTKQKRRLKARRRLQLDRLTDTQFEEFTADLLDDLNFVNIDWRKGTGKDASPADGGRDIECQLVQRDVDGSVQLETWFVDCKHFKRGVPPTELQNLLAWAQAKQPDAALFVVSNFLSNGAKDYLKAYRSNQKPAFRIKVWERPTLERLAASRIALLRRHNLIDEPIRSVRAILKAEQEFFDKVWYDRHMGLMRSRAKGREERWDPKVLKGALAAETRIRDKYGKQELGPWNDFEWGMLSGQLSAIRWVLGADWDSLDT